MRDINVIEALIDADVICLKQLVKMIPGVKNAIKEFNGKMFNVRVTNAINEQVKSIGRVIVIKREYSSSKIKLYPSPANRGLVKCTDKFGKTSWLHSQQYDSHVIYCNLDLDTERVEADKIIPYLDLAEKEFREQIEKLRRDKPLLHKMVKKREKMLAMIEAYNSYPKSWTVKKDMKIELKRGY